MRKSKSGYPRGVFEKEPGSGVFWIRYQDADGRERKEKVGSLRNAGKLVENRRTDARRGLKLPETLRARPATFGEIAKTALEYSKANKRSYRNDIYRMAMLVEKFGTWKAEAIKPRDIENWLASQTQWKVSTKNRTLALMKLAFRLAEKNETIKTNPARLVQQKDENNKRVRYVNQYDPLPTEEEYLKPYTTEETRVRAVIAKRFPAHMADFDLAIHTGMRSSEQYGLEWTSVNFERRLLTIPRSKHGEERHIQLNAAAISTLKSLLPNMERSNFVFRGVQNSRYWFEKRVIPEAGIRDFHWHDLRHTFASRLAMVGVDIRTIQELMGHKNITTTMRYAHLTPAHLQSAVERLDAYTNGTSIAPDPEAPRISLKTRR
jgi:site-specific recombinase XerD